MSQSGGLKLIKKKNELECSDPIFDMIYVPSSLKLYS